uniref:Uncharacterized protein n=1 Tax=Corethron hystrix TaxID=216773 RepID=A0A7S1FWL0_9STRA|mmetsp:Transcript_37830/g.88063  ORF Transcript_37830/g.88063 Transcript_37830/m.88063 type:complete len:246 (-) Transcript_37830:175-912(-)
MDIHYPHCFSCSTEIQQDENTQYVSFRLSQKYSSYTDSIGDDSGITPDVSINFLLTPHTAEPKRSLTVSSLDDPDIARVETKTIDIASDEQNQSCAKMFKHRRRHFLGDSEMREKSFEAVEDLLMLHEQTNELKANMEIYQYFSSGLSQNYFISDNLTSIDPVSEYLSEFGIGISLRPQVVESTMGWTMKSFDDSDFVRVETKFISSVSDKQKEPLTEMTKYRRRYFVRDSEIKNMFNYARKKNV